MTEYRAVLRHVRYWRGVVHRWSQVFPLTGSMSGGALPGVVDILQNMAQETCYPDPTGHGGGLWEVSIYDQATGGVPIYTRPLFDPDVPADWAPYGVPASNWLSVTPALESVAETAMLCEWAGGLSASGKPVKFRNWFHAVPVAGGTSGAADISSGNVAALQEGIQTRMSQLSSYGVLHGRGGRLASSIAHVQSYYGNHQMPRGRRRRRVSSTSSGVITLPVGVFLPLPQD